MVLPTVSDHRPPSSPVDLQVRRIIAAFPVPMWSRDRREEYARALSRFPSKVIAGAVTNALDAVTKDICPPPGFFVEHARSLARQEGVNDTASMHNGATKERELPTPAHVPVMWYAALVASGRAHGRAVAVPEDLHAYVALAEELGLRPEHGVGPDPASGRGASPMWQPGLVKEADRRFAALHAERHPAATAKSEQSRFMALVTKALRAPRMSPSEIFHGGR